MYTWVKLKRSGRSIVVGNKAHPEPGSGGVYVSSERVNGNVTREHVCVDGTISTYVCHSGQDRDAAFRLACAAFDGSGKVAVR